MFLSFVVGIRDANIMLKMFTSIAVEYSVGFCLCNVVSALGIKVVLVGLAWVEMYPFSFQPLKATWSTNVIYPLNLFVKFASELW